MVEQGDYINSLLDTDGNELTDPESTKLFHRLRQAKGEGDTAAGTISRLQEEVNRLGVLINNRQGRFDALANLLYEAKTEAEATPTPAEELPPALEEVPAQPADVTPSEEKPPAEPIMSENN